MVNGAEFIRAYDEHADAIFRYCYFRVFDREKARDLVQECYLRTWNYLLQGHSIENFRAFLYRTARNLIIDNSRKKREESLEIMQEHGFEPSIDDFDQVVTHLDAEALLERVKTMDEIYRETLLMRYVEDMTPKEIAEALGETENVISVRLHRGIKKLKELV